MSLRERVSGHLGPSKREIESPHGGDSEQDFLQPESMSFPKEEILQSEQIDGSLMVLCEELFDKPLCDLSPIQEELLKEINEA